MKYIVERLRSPDFTGDECNDLLGEAADEIERLRERVAELKPYEVVSGDTWKSRVSYEMLEQQRNEIKQLEKERDSLNLRIKSLQLKLSERDQQIEAYRNSMQHQSSPESEGVSG